MIATPTEDRAARRDLVADLVLGTTPVDLDLDRGFFALGRFAAGPPHQPRHRYARVLLGR